MDLKCQSSCFCIWLISMVVNRKNMLMIMVNKFRSKYDVTIGWCVMGCCGRLHKSMFKIIKIDCICFPCTPITCTSYRLSCYVYINSIHCCGCIDKSIIFLSIFRKLRNIQTWNFILKIHSFFPWHRSNIILINSWNYLELQTYPFKNVRFFGNPILSVYKLYFSLFYVTHVNIY